MLRKYARLVYRYQVWFLLFGLFCMGGGLAYASGIFGSLSQSGFVAPNSQSQAVDKIVNDNFGGNRNSLVLLFYSQKLKYTNPLYRSAVDGIVGNIASLPIVNSVNSYYRNGGSQFVAKNPHYTYALVGLKGDANQQANEVSQITPWITSPIVKVSLGGEAAANSQLTGYIQKDLKTAELFSFPVTALLLVLIFGSLVAAALPLALGLYGIIGALVICRFVTYATPISAYVLDIVSLLGLGLGIDYSLFIVSRYREELAARPGDEEEALARTVETAGKTVIFSGLTVMASVAGLVVFPMDYIRSMGIGGASAVLIALVGSLLFLPALLAVLGQKVNSLKFASLVPKRYKGQLKNRQLWRSLTRAVIRYPVITVVATLAVILLVASPFVRIHFISSGVTVLPPTAPARVVSEQLDRNFTYGNQSPLDVLVPISSIKNRARAEAYVNRLLKLPSVAGLGPYQYDQSYLLLTVLPKTSTYSIASENLVSSIRSLDVSGVRGEVGGSTANLVDTTALIRHSGIYAAIVVLIAMLVLFFLLLGSIIIPLKTIILTTLSMSAAFGVLVWIFQQGHLNSLLGITSQQGIDASQLVIIFALAFGLSMDYAAFLFSRIKERFNVEEDMGKAVVWGVQKTGTIITSAAALLLVVISAFAIGRVVSMKEVAIGLIVAVLVDVLLVRLLLVPASMKLLGKYNWWLPKSLRKIYLRFGISDQG